MDRTAFKLDYDFPVVINFSGGRSSGYMLYRILEAYGGYEYLPPDTIIAFCNTGKEYPQTLDFVQECSDRWQVPILWLEYRNYPMRRGGRRDPRHDALVVNHRTASRDGQPFDQMVAAKKLLPNVDKRICTFYLKVEVVRWFVQRRLGWKFHINALGMRADEPQRINKALFEECKIEYPLWYGEVDKEEVLSFWSRSDFDLDLPPDKSNCNLCFLKGVSTLVPIIREDPSQADWWIAKEEERGATFTNRLSYTELRDLAMTPEGDKFLIEQLNLFADEPTIDCFCGD